MRLARKARWSFTEVAVALKWELGGWGEANAGNERGPIREGGGGGAEDERAESRW